MLSAVERVRLRVGERRQVKYPTDPRHWRERRFLSSEEWHGRGVDPGLGHVSCVSKR